MSVSENLTDTLSDRAGFSLGSVAVNEPAAPEDVTGFVVGSASTTGQLRATRAGGGSGRIYTLDYAGRDRAGNEGACAVTVTVPHDQRP